MLRPIKEILVSRPLGTKVYLYKLSVAPHQLFPYSLSLLPMISSDSKRDRSIFAHTGTDNQELFYSNYIEDASFVSLMQDLIKSSHKELRYLLSSRAQRQVDGWLSLVDERATLIYGRAAEPDDTIGFCLAQDGKILPETYSPMPSYRLISRLGIFSLPLPLYRRLIKGLEELSPN